MEISKLQPLYAFVELSVGDIVLSSFTDSISDSVIDLVFERKSNREFGSAGSKFTISLYDDSAMEIEEIISKSIKNDDSESITINYGWAHSSSARISQSSLKGVVTEYSLSFEGASVNITITGTISSLYEAKGNVKSEEYSADEYEGKPSKVVRKICEDEGWEIGYIEETVPQMNEDGTVKTFVRNNICSGEFIATLLEESESQEIEGSIGYYFFFSEDGKAYFVSENNTTYQDLKTEKVTPDGTSQNNSVTYEESNRSSSTDTEISRTYEFYSGRTDNTVISFTPEFVGKCIDNIVPGSTLAVDSVKNEMLACTVSNKLVSDTSSKRIMGVSSTSFEKLKAKSESMWCKYGKWSYNATLEIMGDPTIEIYSKIYVAVYTKYGFLHHTSGIYLVKGAEDNISGGNFTTTLSLLKLGNNKDDMRSQEEAENFYSSESNSSSSESSGDDSGSTSGTPGESIPVDGSTKLSHPCPGNVVTSKFGPRVPPKPGASSYHKGIDLSGAHYKIYAAGDGTVTDNGYNNSAGNFLIIDHGNNIVTAYYHLKEKYVKKGEKVKAGQNIAYMGSTGISTGAHLHFEVRVKGTPVNPAPYIGI